MVLRNLLAGLALVALAALFGHAHAQIYKCLDTSGRPLYTSEKRDTAGKNCTLVSREVSVVPSGPARSSTTASGTNGVAARTENRRKILESELQSEEQLLADARQKLAAQEGTRSGDERNYARVLERLKPFQETVDQHQKNIDQLKQELGKLK